MGTWLQDENQPKHSRERPETIGTRAPLFLRTTWPESQPLLRYVGKARIGVQYVRFQLLSRKPEPEWNTT